jgi:glycopeptide antibiotics resistance protein
VETKTWKWTALWALWLAVIISATTIPWSNFKGHSHWGKVRWIPFRDDPLASVDNLANVALFLPFGSLYFMAVPLRSKRVTILSGLVVSALLSGGAEFFQVFCHNRIPSTTDVLTNVCGAGIGLWLANLFTKSSRGRT